MTQKNKELLLKELCARLPYEVKIKFVPNETIKDIIYIIDGEYSYIAPNYTILNEENIKYLFNGYWKEYKPYLFPLSSMKEEQRKELYKMGWYLYEDKIYSSFRNYDDVNYKTHIDCFELMNWCYKNNFDINGLIPMGLAIDCTGLGIY